MSANQSLTPLRRPGTLSLLVLSLISGVLSLQAVAQAPPPAKPAPDVIVFTNGDQLTGTLVRGVGNSVVFKSDIVGEVTVSMDKVKELHSNGNFVALKKNEIITRTSKRPGAIVFTDSIVRIADSS